MPVGNWIKSSFLMQKFPFPPLPFWYTRDHERIFAHYTIVSFYYTNIEYRTLYSSLCESNHSKTYVNYLEYVKRIIHCTLNFANWATRFFNYDEHRRILTLKVHRCKSAKFQSRDSVLNTLITFLNYKKFNNFFRSKIEISKIHEDTCKR